MNDNKVNSQTAPLLIVYLFCACLFSWLILPAETILHLTAEWGIIENASLVSYFFAVFILWMPMNINQSSLPTRLAATIILLAMAAREASLHQFIKGVSMLKTRFWFSYDFITWQDKALALLVLLPIAISVLYFIIKYKSPFIVGLKQRVPHFVTIFCFIALIILTNAIDRSVDIFNKTFDIVMPQSIVALQQAIEEPFELLLPFLIILCVFEYGYYVARENLIKFYSVNNHYRPVNTLEPVPALKDYDF